MDYSRRNYEGDLTQRPSLNERAMQFLEEIHTKYIVKHSHIKVNMEY